MQDLKQKYAEVSVPDFYQFLLSERVPKLFSSSLHIMVMCGSTYIYDQFFWTTEINLIIVLKTDVHLYSMLRLDK